MKLSLIPFLLLIFFASAPANAVVLHGVVSEVPDGSSVVVLSNGRKLTVSLKGVEAPALKQDFGDVARQHLASLVLDKAVQIDFSELKGSHVFGKLICDRIDIGLQVIRDGAAWYDTRNPQRLSEEERSAYAAAQEAARNEMRGLWQDGSPMPPWEWRRAEAEKFFPVVRTRTSRGQGLRTEDLLFSGARSGVLAPGAANGRDASAKPSQKPLNTPGQDVDYSSYLRMGRTSIVYFYADWCPACRQLTPSMERINAGSSDVQVLFMNIADWNTPVARQHGVTFVPYLKIYDKSGNLVSEGREARAWLQQNRR